ncbi:hypothetical protein [Microlunatus speluncae]|uniref:hypothetical protein n=1 Tax=Microlunatus speluncae TaxID=2594267 RepID=UPI001C2CD74E|nr:hypothetical protein [Microlunatus speluncae]
MPTTQPLAASQPGPATADELTVAIAEHAAEVATRHVLADIAAERRRQDEKWGEQNHPDGTGGELWTLERDQRIRITDHRFAEGTGTWSDVLAEEFAEAMAEIDPDRLRAELVQVAAVATGWIEAIDRRPL